jgi:hypothetical protein
MNPPQTQPQAARTSDTAVREDIRNIAIIAHVDRKTTLVDQPCGRAAFRENRRSWAVMTPAT